MSELNPGTVSKILWHFTGGPMWNSKKNEQEKKLKNPADAFDKLKMILKSRTLKVGRFKEVVKITLPTFRKYSLEEKKIIELKNHKITMESSPVCCLADIPAVHLGYHAKRYGQFAIGFHRDSVVKHGFNPVLYTLSTTEVIRHIYEGLSSIESIDASEITSAAESISVDDYGEDIEIDTSDVEAAAEDLQNYAYEAQQSIHNFIAFIKTFERDQFNSIYCEREWRSVTDFNFSPEDIAMIIVPNQIGKIKYFEQIISEVKKLKISRGTPIVPWEDLVEH